MSIKYNTNVRAFLKHNMYPPLINALSFVAEKCVISIHIIYSQCENMYVTNALFCVLHHRKQTFEKSKGYIKRRILSYSLPLLPWDPVTPSLIHDFTSLWSCTWSTSMHHSLLRNSSLGCQPLPYSLLIF